MDEILAGKEERLKRFGDESVLQHGRVLGLSRWREQCGI
jgi:hypothetical protein